jgi:uncharacterized membrane protein YesL
MSTGMSYDGAREAAWRGLPAQVAALVWANLPLLLVLDAVLALAAVPAGVAVLSGGYLVAPVLAGMIVVPVWTAVVAATDRMAAGDAVSLRTWARLFCRHAVRGLAFGLVAAAASTATLGALAARAVLPELGWLALPLIVDGSVLVLLAVAGLSVFSLATTGGLRGWTLFRAALELAATHKLATAGTVGLLVLLAFLVMWLPGSAVVLPAPLAVYLSVWTAAAVGRRPDGAAPSDGHGDGSGDGHSDESGDDDGADDGGPARGTP